MGKRTPVALVALCLLSPSFLSAAPPRVLPPGKLPADQRLKPLKDLDGYFPFRPSESRKQWERRADQLRRQLLVAFGLWPMPTKTPLNAVIHGRIDLGDYTVEKAYFESFPGFYVTGNLYRPKGKSGKRPGVLCPHGHWSNGRFYDAGLQSVRKQIEEGGERFEVGGRSPLQARCVQLARMGCVVFHYDMIGYADSTQISFQVAHRFAKQRPDMNGPKGWGLYSPRAEAHLQSVMGMQTYNSIRALDFLTGLEDVDPQRLAVTGGSGGGTQTMLLSAIDPRVAVSMPAVMVSTAMQGGCTCENCTLLRVGTGNIEFAALFAPKPQGLTAANDWTKEIETKGYPQLQQHYKLLGAPDNVMLHARLEFGHNYNAPSRTAMYGWFNKHLKLEASTDERDYKRLSPEEMTVWNDKHPQPEGGPEVERKLLKWWTEDARKQLAALGPTDADSLDRYREVVGSAVHAIVGRGLPPAADIEFEQTVKNDRDDYLEIGGLLRNTVAKEELPVLFLHPAQWNGAVVIWLDEDGKSGLYTTDGSLQPAILDLLARGTTVVGADLLFQGEFLSDGKPLTKTRRVKNPREAAAYTFGYNHSVFASRVHDILGLITFVQNHELTPKHVDLVALDGTGPLAAVARAQARGSIDRVAINTNGFRFGDVQDIHDPSFLPGGAKYGDLVGLLALGAPHKIWLTGEKEIPPLVKASYAATKYEQDSVTLFDGKSPEAPQAVAQWLLEEY